MLQPVAKARAKIATHFVVIGNILHSESNHTSKIAGRNKGSCPEWSYVGGFSAVSNGYRKSCFNNAGRPMVALCLWRETDYETASIKPSG
ncbi:hypothetical protein [Mesorhizobium sp. M0643]|uniref:hypothetical protein n=1 Tax=unclassified Mesorhizobium TaxID=325217 RepID=UPI0033366DC5